LPSRHGAPETAESARRGGVSDISGGWCSTGAAAPSQAQPGAARTSRAAQHRDQGHPGRSGKGTRRLHRVERRLFAGDRALRFHGDTRCPVDHAGVEQAAAARPGAHDQPAADIVLSGTGNADRDRPGKDGAVAEGALYRDDPECTVGDRIFRLAAEPGRGAGSTDSAVRRVQASCSSYISFSLLTTFGSANVVVSPRARPSAMTFSILRIVFPLRAFVR